MEEGPECCRWAERSLEPLSRAGDRPRTTAVDRRSTPSARADRQEALPMFRCPGSPGFPDHLITVCSCVYGGGPLTSGGKCGTTELSPIIDLCVPTAVVYPRGQCAPQVLLPVKIGCGLVEQ